MMVCENCGAMLWESNLGEGDSCLYCGRDVVEAVECRHCHAEFAPDEIDGGLCPDCRIEVQRLYTAFWDSLPLDFQEYILDTDYHPAG